MKLEKWQYYSGKAPASVYKEKPFSLKVMKGDIIIRSMLMMNTQRQRMKYQYLETCINSVERILKQIDNRGFAIKNAFDIIKYCSYMTIIRKKNEVYLKVETEAHIHKELAEHFCFEVPQAKFMPVYRKRVWDGKIRLYSLAQVRSMLDSLITSASG